MKLVLIPMLLIGLCMGCASTENVSAEQLKYTRWQLAKIDGKPTPVKATIRFIEALQINGFAGCNKFFASGELADNHLTVSKLGHTRKLCTAERNKVEQLFLNTLSKGTKITMTNSQLVLQAKQKLVFVAQP